MAWRKKRLDDLGEWENWEIPPLDEETEALLRARGIAPVTGGADPDFKPLPQLPPWLAFIFRTFPFLNPDR